MTSMDMSIPFHVLEQTTEKFSDKQMIGSGGYGKVYKGVYNGEHIAVKLFYGVQALDKTFENECFNILRIQHPNIIRILCFELMQGGSLDKYLNESRDYDWPTCYDIIKGTCEGLNFLHTGCGSQILHLDLKPGNILLDKDMRAKVADFGLSRFLSKQHTHITNTIAGTDGYMPPEFWSKRQISPKNDVYSLGIIIIEILVGRRGYLEFHEMDDVTPFNKLVIEKWQKWICAMTSPCPSAEIDQVETCIKIAIKCVDRERENRPTVAEILNTLRETEKRFHLLGQSLPTPTKIGPRGGMGGSICDIEENPWRLTSLTIFCRGIIDSISFSYIDQYGRKQHVGPWGVDYISQNTETICFGSSEFVEEVSGAYGNYRGILRVISLTFVTNVRTYGPFGNPYHEHMAGLTHFRFMADEGSRIVGFHGRSGSYIDAIGVYMYPNDRTTVGLISVPLILDGQGLPTPTKSGSWGGSGGSARDINQKSWRLTSLTVSYKGLIDAFSFSYIDQAGKKQSVGPWGEGYYNDTTKTISFGPAEFVKEVCGAYGNHNGIVIVKFLTFVTNEGTYGPFGTPDHPGPDVSATHFRFVADEGSTIVGFYGRSGRYIDAIGVYTVRVR
ncbi:putative proline-rich receptor-like protein kinase PERK6 isoform X3 [Triticum aestivum]|uniref:putative proline-rich receptor-like protein kinase PERK6 isoform X3 n=1 Tax=Triticum aestivum TaxID=4565 RepID=UPI001D030AB4|nr:putative proline-rich receptor-like protein kinase PERK6 isoform X3 [Triticum aestivum]